MKKIAVLAAFVFTGFTLFALEISEGRTKLVLHEKTGRFSAYYLTDVKNSGYSSFFVDQDPRTTVLGILMDNTVYTMGEAFDFTQTAEKTDTGARFIWRSKAIEVTEEFRFITSPTASLANGFSITLSITNISTDKHNIGLKYLFDTYIGEKDDAHFITRDGANIDTEYGISGAMPAYWYSDSDEGISFMGMMSGGGVTKPDDVVFANWKRLDENDWNYQVNTNRNFNKLPYSINDSAVCYYFDPITVDPDDTRQIVMALGIYAPAGFLLGQKSSEVSDIFEKALTVSNIGDDKALAVRTEILTTEEILSQIDRLLKEENPSEADITVIEQTLSEMEQRKSQYSD